MTGSQFGTTVTRDAVLLLTTSANVWDRLTVNAAGHNKGGEHSFMRRMCSEVNSLGNTFDALRTYAFREPKRHNADKQASQWS